MNTTENSAKSNEKMFLSDADISASDGVVSLSGENRAFQTCSTPEWYVMRVTYQRAIYEDIAAALIESIHRKGKTVVKCREVKS